jgi:hypothetical protein
MKIFFLSYLTVSNEMLASIKNVYLFIYYLEDQKTNKTNIYYTYNLDKKQRANYRSSHRLSTNINEVWTK